MGGFKPPFHLLSKACAGPTRAWHTAEFARLYASYDMNPIASTPQEFVKYLREEMAKWSKVIKTAGIRVQ